MPAPSLFLCGLAHPPPPPFPASRRTAGGRGSAAPWRALPGESRGRFLRGVPCSPPPGRLRLPCAAPAPAPHTAPAPPFLHRTCTAPTPHPHTCTAPPHLHRTPPTPHPRIRTAPPHLHRTPTPAPHTCTAPPHPHRTPASAPHPHRTCAPAPRPHLHRTTPAPRPYPHRTPALHRTPHPHRTCTAPAPHPRSCTFLLLSRNLAAIFHCIFRKKLDLSVENPCFFCYNQQVGEIKRRNFPPGQSPVR